MSFESLGLIEPLRRALEAEGYTAPTPIQSQAIPQLLTGRDLLGCAQTGTGKTAAFALPILQQLEAAPRPKGIRPIRALVLSPTRELAAQIGDSFQSYGRFLGHRHLVLFGGVGMNPQIDALKRGLDILIATPGRLLDLAGQGHIDLRNVQYFVLDEADRMLDMGFIHDIRRVLRLLPQVRQNFLFSATMPDPIAELAGSFLRDPLRVEVVPQSTTAERIDQSISFVDKNAKASRLVELLRHLPVSRAIVFTRTKHGANRLVEKLERDGIQAAAIHGNKSQSARTRAMNGFRDGSIPILVATDIAARGIDVDDVSHVFNFDLPDEPESYVHRIGRTGRAGQAGIAISFCDPDERENLRDIERIIGMQIPAIDGRGEAVTAPPDARLPPRGQGGPSRVGASGQLVRPGQSDRGPRPGGRPPQNNGRDGSRGQRPPASHPRQGRRGD